MSKRRPADNIEFKSFEDLFGISDVKEEDIQEIRIEEIHSFSNHPFKVMDDKRMIALVNSVRENGIMTPVLLRRDSSGYEIISGHRRTFAAKQVGLASVPAIVREMTDDEAVIAMVDSNLQRDVILPSEKAFALRMKLDAMKHQGKRTGTGETSCQSGTKSRSDEVLARSLGTSASNIHRLIRLTYLREGLLDLVDRKKIGMSQAVDLSYIDADGQDLILASNGTAAIVCFPGIIYRGGAEMKIRKYLIDNNYVDCVIQLPSNLFFGTSIATCIMVLKKGKPDSRVLFIDATNECIKVTNNNKLTQSSMDKIVNTFASRKEIRHFSHLAGYDEVAGNDYNLSVSTYVEAEDTREKIDIVKLNAEIREIVAREQVLRDEIDKIIVEIEGRKNG